MVKHVRAYTLTNDLNTLTHSLKNLVKVNGSRTKKRRQTFVVATCWCADNRRSVVPYEATNNSHRLSFRRQSAAVGLLHLTSAILLCPSLENRTMGPIHRLLHLSKIQNKPVGFEMGASLTT